MPRPLNIPESGDVTVKHAAQYMALPEERFCELYPQLLENGFPERDPVTGNFSIEAIRRWRLARHQHLFPEVPTANSLTGEPVKSDAEAIKDSLRERLGNG